MVRRSTIILIIGLLAIGTLLFFQTPLMARLRGAVWDSWTLTIGRLARIGPLALEGNVNEQLQTLRADNVRLQTELNDYKRLREQLGLPSFASFRTIAAGIVGRPLDIFHTHHTLNRGAEEGVTLHAPVVIRSSILLGFISQLHDHSSILELLFQPGPGLAVEIIDPQTGQSVGRGLLQGQHFSSLRLTTVPRDAAIAPGQVVVTLAKEAAIPPGLTIGSLQQITTSQSEAYQEATIDVPYDPDSLDAATIIVPP